MKAVLIPGDGIGREIAESVRAVSAALNTGIDWQECEAGAEYAEVSGELIAPGTLDAIEECGWALKGPTATPIGKGFRSINVQLRQRFSTYANLRPVHTLPGVPTRFDNVDLVIVRERTGGIYFGEHGWREGKYGQEAYDVERYSEMEIRRIAKVAFNGYAFPAEGSLPQGVDYAVKMGPWPYDVKKAKQLLAEAGYPNGFETTLWSAYNHTTGQKVIQFIQQQLAQVGIKAQVQALEAGQRVEKVESHQDPATAPVRLYYTGWSSSTGEADWGLRPLFAGDKTPPAMYNISYYKNPTVDADIMKALGTTDRAEKTKLYTEVQEEIWKDAPWAFLVTEKLLYATNKKLTGMYVMPDANYFFENIDLQQ